MNIFKITDKTETCWVLAFELEQAMKLATKAGYFLDQGTDPLDWTDLPITEVIEIQFDNCPHKIAHTVQEWMAIFEDWRVICGTLQ